MAVTMMRQESGAMVSSYAQPSEPFTVCELTRGDEEEVLEFLSVRPLHTVFMAGLINDNGLISPNNRGSFYACRGNLGQLEGVALVGHATIIEAGSESAIASFAMLARRCQISHLIRAEREIVDKFWKYYAGDHVAARRICTELLFAKSETQPVPGAMTDLRQATLDDLDKVLAVNALMAFEEGGVSPLQKDPGGFRRRTARRIQQGRIWVLLRDHRLIFKADVIAMTPEVAYLEGVHVHPDERRKGYGLRCLTQLSSTLLLQTNAICLTINQKNEAASAFYQKAGYEFHSNYETIYLR
jgi:predicted GNAT family acetyltransferase